MIASLCVRCLSEPRIARSQGGNVQHAQEPWAKSGNVER